MSYHKIKDIYIEPNTVRDFFQPFAKSANFKIDLWQEHGVVGLDLFIHNRGASALTLGIDKGDALTIDAGDTFSWDNIKYAFIEVTSTVAYDLVVAGKHLKRGVGRNGVALSKATS